MLKFIVSSAMAFAWAMVVYIGMETGNYARVAAGAMFGIIFAIWQFGLNQKKGD